MCAVRTAACRQSLAHFIEHLMCVAGLKQRCNSSTSNGDFRRPEVQVHLLAPAQIRQCSQVDLFKSRSAQDPNWGKGPPGEPEMAPAQEKQPGFVVGPTSPGKPKGNFCLG
ncbi:unnamed protein product [Prunus armeniaca]